MAEAADTNSGGGSGIESAQKSIVFDTGPIISLALNSLLWLLEPLKKSFGGRFCIPVAVKRELIDRPLQIKRFKFEALQVLSYMDRGVLEVIEDGQAERKTKYLMDLANSIFMGKNNPMQIVHYGEMQALAFATMMGSSAFVVDERTTRLLIEDPDRLKELMEHKLHTKISMDRKKLDEFRKETKGIRLIRSTELAIVAYELGLLDMYVPHLPNSKSELLDSVLWGIKLNGCSISEREIETIIKAETKGAK